MGKTLIFWKMCVCPCQRHYFHLLYQWKLLFAVALPFVAQNITGHDEFIID